MSTAYNIIVGLAVGDILGVPVEFRLREELSRDPVTDVRGYGTYNVPPGWFSDDLSLLFCLADTLSHGMLDLHHLAGNFQRWLHQGWWCPADYVFDVGNATRDSIEALAHVDDPRDAGATHERAISNGSLMRILPLAMYTLHMEPSERHQHVEDVLRLTHGHPRVLFACIYFIELATALIKADPDPMGATNRVLTEMYFSGPSKYSAQRLYFERLLSGDLLNQPASDIGSLGYAIDCLEAAVWCVFTSLSYREAVLRAVNLGEDTDTTGCVAGGLAALRFGDVPEEWARKLARYDDITKLVALYEKAMDTKT